MIDYLPPKEKEYTELIRTIYPKSEARTITFQVTEDCNLKCSYCYQHKKTNNKMNFEIAKKFIDQLLQDKFELCTLKNTKVMIYEFIGGEPFLEIDLIYQIVSYTINAMIKIHHPWLPFFKVSICSNGILYMNKNVQHFFNIFHNFIGLTISIDGNQILHDSCRKDKNNLGTYKRAIEAVKLYKKQYHIQMPTKMTLAPENIKYLYDAVINLINENYTEIHLNCVYEDVWNIEMAKIFYNELKKVGDYLLNNNLYNKINIILFNEDFFVPIDESDNLNHCGGISDKNIAINYKGEMFTCIRYMESSLNGKQKPLIIGDIYNGYLAKNEYKENYNLMSNITRRSQSDDECFYCRIGKGCGWCSALNYEISGTPNKRNKNICIMHKARAMANEYYWNKLYKKLNIEKTFAQIGDLL